MYSYNVKIYCFKNDNSNLEKKVVLLSERVVLGEKNMFNVMVSI